VCSSAARARRRDVSRAGAAPGLSTLGFRAGPPDPPMELDVPTVELHRKYHEATIQYTMENMEWAQSKGYQLDAGLSTQETEHLWRAQRERLFRWPRLHDQDVHVVALGGPGPQRFCRGGASPEDDARACGDPGDHVFVISLARRPTRLKHALHQLHAQGVSATIVDAVDGDTVLYQEDLERVGVAPLPGYMGHKNHDILLTTGEVGCFMSHFTIWQHMVENNIQSVLILEDDFDLQEGFSERLGQYLEEAKGEDWNILFVGRSPMEGDWRRISEHIVEPGYTLWTVGYVMRLDAAQRLVDAAVQRSFAPLDDFFSVLMGRGQDAAYNDQVHGWWPYLPTREDGMPLLRPLAATPPLVMPYVGSMFLSDTAMLRKKTRYIEDLPLTSSSDGPRGVAAGAG